MIEGGARMIRGKGLILAMTVAFASACASGGGGMEGDEPGNRPRDNSFTNSAGVHLMQAGLTEGQESTAHFQAAMTDAMDAIREDSANPKGYLMAGQAAVGLEEWTRADTMFEKAVELYPPYSEQISSEREQGWVNAYNLGAEAMSAGNLDRALYHFEGADMLYQDRAEARMALGSLYLRQGDTEKAIEAYRGALEILSGPPPEGMAEEQLAAWERDRQVAAFNAAQLLAESGDYAEGAAVLEGFLAENEGSIDPSTQLRAKTAMAGFLAEAGESERAEAIFEEVLGRTDLTSAEYFQIGIGFFNIGDYTRAADAFREAAELNPFSRDALLNLVQSLYSEALDVEEMEQSAERDERLNEIYDNIIDAASRVRAFDPLNRNLLSFMLRSLRAKTDLAEGSAVDSLTQETQRVYRSYQQQTYEVSDVNLSVEGGNQARITGSFTNISGTAGDQVQIEFSAVGQDGQILDSSIVNVTVPEQESSTQFATTVDLSGGDFAGWRYELVN